MDPNANLEEQRRLIAKMLDSESEYIDTDDAIRLAEYAQALDIWIEKGGFLPKPWLNSSAVSKVVTIGKPCCVRPMVGNSFDCANCGKVYLGNA